MFHFAPNQFVNFVHHVPPLLPNTFYETAFRFPTGPTVSQIADLVIAFILAPFPRNAKNPHQPERHRRTDRCGYVTKRMKLLTAALCASFNASMSPPTIHVRAQRTQHRPARSQRATKRRFRAQRNDPLPRQTPRPAFYS